MARYIDSKCKLCRREGMKLFLKGQRCFTDKCAVSRRDYPPGVHAQKRTKVTDYGVRMREKQKLKRIYGVWEKQFKLYFREAERMKGNTGENLMALLERRLDNVVLASGFALSRNHARQLVNHGHFTVNGSGSTSARSPCARATSSRAARQAGGDPQEPVRPRRSGQQVAAGSGLARGQPRRNLSARVVAMPRRGNVRIRSKSS
jgi:hypothetical protein